MFKNNYPITRWIGIIVILFSVFLFYIFYENAQRSVELGSSMFNTGKLKTYGLIVVLFITGVGFLFQRKWARILLTIFLIIFSLIVLFLGISSQLSGSFNIKITGLTIFITVCIMTLIALLYNQKLDNEFDKSRIENTSEALDSDFLNKK